ncbi:hypothetical protein MNBD_NITROSPINAE02-193 [hydrothermal vent metagenome]|uniref:Uncharacterized protein n=1 Tax=hydrothermal vent metagenome TaxID=652676 RepID=A0A3B1CIA8_9ZZZZ
MLFHIFSFFLIIVSISANLGRAETRDWGQMAERFLLPLTYPDFDPEDFGDLQDPQDLDIIIRFSPKVYAAPGSGHPIDFYKDYLPRCVVRNSLKNNEIIIDNPSREDVKRMERTNGVYLDYTGPTRLSGSPVAYARVYRENVSIGKKIIPFVFIKYSFIFPASGLPKKLAWYKSLAGAIAGDPDRWHELDIHGAVTIALAQKEERLTPIALILAQHNHFRVYLFGRDAPLPKDGHASIGFADRSNEPYPAPEGDRPAEHATVGDPTDFSYVITGRGFALTSGRDVVYGPDSGGEEVEYEIKRLPSKDPLYVAWIPLGEKLKLFGFIDSFYRDGPPGIDLFTWPELSDYGRIMKFWFVDDGDERAARLFDEHFGDFFNVNFEPIYQYNSKRFIEETLKLHPEFK